MHFRDRADAGRQLAAALLERHPDLRDHAPIVLGIPRGGVAVGYEVARALGAPLDVLVARKLGAPGHEELAIGAVAPGGARVLDDDLVEMLGVTPEYIARVTQDELVELERRTARYRDARPAPALAGRAAVVVDDGLATGSTARAALLAARAGKPALLLFAAPVCSPEGRDSVARLADDVVCAMTPAAFRGVGEWYRDFAQLDDEDVMALLDASPH